MSKDMQGLITYIYMENFVTYNKVEVKPDRHLNVIIGPNGTGKSTIVCAIVLGLGGKPSTIGRALHVKEYVKAGCEEAKIVIHLKSNTNKDIVVKRLFNIQGKTVWYLDNNITNIDAIKKLTTSMNIQVDNLCQFLPQDKVQEFSKMNAQELLENTEKSVADPEILEFHKRLIELRGSHKTWHTDIANKKKLLGVKTQIYDGLKDSVSNIKEKKVIKRKIIALKQKKAWMLYDQMRGDLLKSKNTRQKLVQTLSSLQAEAKPINDAIEKIDKEIGILKNSIATNTKKVDTEKRRLKKLMDDINACQSSIKDSENLCKQRIQAEKTRDQEIDLEKQRKEKHENDLTNIMLELGSDETLSRRKEELTRAIDEQRRVINTLANKSNTTKQEVEKVAVEIRSLEADLQLFNIETKRMQLLHEKSKDAYRATLWLRDHRDRFSGRIYEPMLLNINVKNASYAKYLENIISNRDLVAFVCEKKPDMNLLMRCLRDEQNLQVNVVHSDPESNIPMEPNIPLDHIRQFGFTHYLISLLEAPPAIMKYLASMYNLNNIPVGTQAVDSNADRVPSNLSCYMSVDNVYVVRVSKYSKDKSTRIRYLSKSGMLSIVLDKSKLQRIENELVRLRQEKTQLTSQAKKFEEEIIEQNKKLDKHRADRNTLQQDVQQVQLLKSRIAISTKKIDDLENQRTSVDKIKQATTKQIKGIIEKELRLYDNYNSNLEDLFDCEMGNEQAKIALQIQTRMLHIKTNDSQDLRDKLKEAEDRLRQMNVDIQSSKNQVQKLYDEALETTGGVNPNEKDFAPINKTFQKLPPTIDDINSELNVAQAKVYCMVNDADAENVLQEYEKVKADIQELEHFITEKSTRLETAQTEMESLQEKWLTPLRQIVNKINENFSTHFSAMNCAGEVALHFGENLLDFDQYGLKIKVKFREADQLQELTRHHQSGGERAVTTAIYMIALQELSRVPFRCVDEINQGMDATNERRVFNLLVKMTAKANSSQYFFLTPKLLPDLEYDETVTVHCVFNGPFVISHTEFDVEEYCKHIKKVLKQDEKA